MSPLRFAILGLGGRGREAYGSWILRHPHRASIVAVADPVPDRHDAGLPEDAEHYRDWRDLLDDLPRLSVDAVVVALPDHLHVEPMERLFELGIPTLLEKPIAPTLEDLDRLVVLAGAREDVPVTVGHVLRFTPFWKVIKQLLEAGTIGDLVTLEIRENIGFWHFAHSYVRGNWRRTATSSPMILAKTCHDLDLIRWLMGTVPESVTSSGSLQYFTARNKPAGAPEFCIQGCPVEDSCPFHAPRYYVEALSGVHGVPVTLLTADTSVEGRREALAVSDYGRCVFRSDNDVADHQVTVLQFADGATASLVASAFTAENTRHVTITGTAGQITGHMESGSIGVDLFSPTGALPESQRDRVTRRGRRGPLGHESVELRALPEARDAGDHRGHAGGDDGLMEAFVSALERGDMLVDEELSLDAALDSHFMAFAAEEARLAGKVIRFEQWRRSRRP